MALQTCTTYEAECDRCSIVFAHKGVNFTPQEAIGDALAHSWVPVQAADGDGCLCPGCASKPAP